MDSCDYGYTNKFTETVALLGLVAGILLIIGFETLCRILKRKEVNK